MKGYGDYSETAIMADERGGRSRSVIGESGNGRGGRTEEGSEVILGAFLLFRRGLRTSTRQRAEKKGFADQLCFCRRMLAASHMAFSFK
jgi:hypothetical protein